MVGRKTMVMEEGSGGNMHVSEFETETHTRTHCVTRLPPPAPSTPNPRIHTFHTDTMHTHTHTDIHIRGLASVSAFENAPLRSPVKGNDKAHRWHYPGAQQRPSFRPAFASSSTFTPRSPITSSS
ncbi:hypothetical protein Vretimale_7464 [Volvox reticuliferus]|uniref:Uncharacterized protein n=1 Tax=Volvox reticuliferus TaxID=1737510 RepID=A0A8J4LM38_9CHLO|nr:hypothetical protein Vretimale_7464 [Volvox reticuliferus]